ncbi:MAG: oligosaccharide repeat unit polymerase [Parcubacteria group bacterium]|nr:oligosaccharide repeat unit polymerase [Parcubacteria group bacterium]
MCFSIVLLMLPKFANALVLETALLVAVNAMLAGLIQAFGDFIGYLLTSDFLNNFTNSKVLFDMWSIVRDFMNMFFILLLLVVAFSTIFDVKRYNAKTLLPKIIIAALLINFSLVIGQVIIDGFNFLADVFAKAIGNPGYKLSAVSQAFRIASADINSNADQNFFVRIANAVVDAASIGFINLTIGTIFLAIWALALILSALVIFIRLPFLWTLLVFAPFAFLAYAFPYLERYKKWWWDKFLYWNYFLPIYLFFMYIGITFLVRSDETIIAQLASGETGLGTAISASIGKFVLAVVTLVAGYMAANSIGGMAAKVTIGAAGGIWGLTGIPGGAKMAWKGIKEQGVRIPGTQRRLFGPQGKERAEAKVGGLIGGLAGIPSLQDQRVLVSQAGKHTKEVLNDEIAQKGFTTKEEMQAYIKSELNRKGINKERHLALMMKAAEEGIMDDATFQRTLNDYGSQTQVINDLVSKMKDKDFAKVSKELLERTFGKGGILQTDLNARKTFYSWLQSDSKQAKRTAATMMQDLDTYVTALQVMGEKPNTSEKVKDEGAFASAMSKIAPSVVAKARASASNSKDSNIPLKERLTEETERFKIVNGLSPSALANLSEEELKNVREDIVNRFVQAKNKNEKSATNLFRTLEQKVAEENAGRREYFEKIRDDVFPSTPNTQEENEDELDILRQAQGE